MSDADTEGKSEFEGQAALSTALAKLDAVREVMSVKRVFGEPYKTDGALIIPVAAVRGGGGGGGGEGMQPGEKGEGSGAGMGFALNVRPVGVFVVEGGQVSWRPSVDVVRIATVVAVAVVVLGWRSRRGR